VQVLEMTLMRAAPRFTHAIRLAALIESQAASTPRVGVTASTRATASAPEVARGLS